MRRNLLAVLLVGVVNLYSVAQQLPVYIQRTSDPYLINPSFVGNNGRPQINMLYRQQWAGVQDGPKMLQADLQYPINDRMALGANVYDDRSVLLSNTSMMVTFGYKIQLTANQTLGFGLSGGFLTYRIRLEDIADENANDPALFSSYNNNTKFSSQFGIHYKIKNLAVGLSLIRLVNNSNFPLERSQASSLYQFHNMIAHAVYQFPLSDKVEVRPSFAYRFGSNNVNTYDLAVLFTYDKTIQAGGGYSEYLGPNVLLRFLKGDFQIGYAVGLPTTQALAPFGTTHEIQFKLLFGEKVKKTTSATDEKKLELYKDYYKRHHKFLQQRKKYRTKIEL